MPELPEVEVTRRKLAPLLLDRRIVLVKTTAPSYFFLTPPKTLARKLKGRSVVELRRHGKYLIAELDDRSRLLLHLGMTGQLIGEGISGVRLLRSTAGSSVHGAAAQRFVPDVHTHLRISLAGDGGDVYFRDPRKFGKVQWLAWNEPCERLDRLGVDALAADGDRLYSAAKRRKVPIKSLLLDQAVLAGVGNIYADEALFRAGISPLRPCCEVSRKRCEILVQAVKAVMVRSIETGGSSISDYIQPDGEQGRFQDERAVYGLTGKPCAACGRALQRVTVGGRSSHYCSHCQH